MSQSCGVLPGFSVRIVVCDNYLTKPIPGLDVIYSEFRGTDIKQVPILRIFGTCPDGRKACLHVHGVFPYFYIPCPTSNPEPQFLYQIAASLDKALNIALKQATSANQHVYKISLVKGLPFYGFHDKDHLYLKVFLYNPGLIKQAVELCSNGAILGQTFQPHESHLNFTLQFFIDFNLFGMSNIDLQCVKFRKSGLSQSSNEVLENSDHCFLKPESICYYEGDCMASHIINRQRIGKGDGIENPGLEEVWQQEKERRKQLNISMSKTLSQGRGQDEQTESHKKFEQMFSNKMSNILENPLEVNVSTSTNEIDHYPAESLIGSQLFNAIDVSMHLPETSMSATLNETSQYIMDSTLIDADETLVDESVALNSSLSLHYSQVLLDSEDLELVDILQEMDEGEGEEDSVLNTPAEVTKEADGDEDDAEYSQAFHDDTILIDQDENENVNDSLSWNDSFWSSVNIPQLDGTCDDDHVKKVRKRKMRAFKLGLTRPKNKKESSVKKEPTKSDVSDSDEINVSRETVDDISDLHLRRRVKPEPESFCKEIECTVEDLTENIKTEDITVTNLVNEQCKIEAALVYDKTNKYVPLAGPSNSINAIGPKNTFKSEKGFSDTSDSSPEDLGIMSFYNNSKVFNMSIEEPITEYHLSVKDDCGCDETNGFDKSSSNITALEILETKSVNGKTILTPKIRPPTRSDIMNCLQKYNIPKTKNPIPFYSNPKDVGDKIEIGQMLLKLHSKCAQDQKPYEKVKGTTSIEEWRQLLFLQTNDTSGEATKLEHLKLLLAGNKQCILKPVKNPPSYREVEQWLEKQKLEKKECTQQFEITKNIDDDLENSQFIGLNDEKVNTDLSLNSQENSTKDNPLQITIQGDGSFLCFGSNKTLTDSKSPSDAPLLELDYLTLMVIEVHTSIRGDLHPDPRFDPILAVFVTVTNDCPQNHFLQNTISQIIVVDSNETNKHLDRCLLKEQVSYVNSENEIIEKIIELVRTHDPDIMCGYEMEMNSWGYLFERAQILGVEIVKELSRITASNRQKRWGNDANNFEGKILGRITFNVWRLFRHELALSSYSFENCMYEILKERVPTFNHVELSKWWKDASKIMRWIPVEYYLTRLSGTIRMLEKLDIINRTSELARLFGLQWWEVLSRGSQFRVESLMLRAARPLNLVALSPTVKQRAAMKAPECLPLIFEPESRFYSDPVIVLDFQSLYPSMMIAYNYCFSTCVGRVQNISSDTAYEFGAWRLRIPKSKLETLSKNKLIHWSPVGVGFVKPSVRRGVLPALLRRILAARQAVKKGMKLQTDEGVKKAMHSRQLGLKLIANVTYGYTAANFSGRMPCVEVGDSVVAKGRETLERAIKLVQDNKDWNVRVIYGDTDSMFVLCPGVSRAEAFDIGRQIADAVTADNPAPVALKLEKVYQPCILQTKKRYVGFMYESADQEHPVYEAKGIETVRRDGCPAGVKLLQQSLCEVFTSQDMSRVKAHVTKCLQRLMSGSLPVHELFFTREYHGPNGYRPGAAAPPKEIANRLCRQDVRAGPRAGERVAWLVSAGPPAATLVSLARTPLELLKHERPPLLGYYVTRVLLPPLQRCLSLLGADVFKWWNDLGYSREANQRAVHGGIARYMWRDRCLVCNAKGTRALCPNCAKGHKSLALIAARFNVAQTDLKNCDMICESCCGHSQFNSCENTECPVLWRRQTAKQKLHQLRDVITNLPTQFTRESLDF